MIEPGEAAAKAAYGIDLKKEMNAPADLNKKTAHPAKPDKGQSTPTTNPDPNQKMIEDIGTTSIETAAGATKIINKMAEEDLKSLPNH